MTIQIKKQVNNIINSILPFKPERVILFGSHAWGKPKKDSDFDLFIIKRTKENPSKRAYRVRQCLNNINEAFDILVFTPQEVQKRIVVNDFFIQDILSKGKVIYEKSKFKTSYGMV